MIPPGVILDERYRIVRLLGEGAMGAVYEAEHVHIGRRVALKLMHPRYTRNPEAVSRFTREARAAAAIGHPHIVAVTDFGTHQHQPFLVMELLRGETLGERIARVNTLPVEDACLVMGQVLSALDAAHAIGVVHRDLKPDNVFVCEDRGLKVKLLDFGVSKFRPPGMRDEYVTKDGLPVGTPHYMAPEQWQGLRDVDLRADLYAVGVMFYEMLTGVVPYEASSQGELYGAVVHGADAPSAPSELAPAVPVALDAFVLKAIARDRAARFQSAEEFLDALRPFGASASIHRAPDEQRLTPSIVPPPPSRNASEPTLTDAYDPPSSVVPRRNVRVRVVAAAAFALVTGVVALAWQRSIARSPSPHALQQALVAPVATQDAALPTPAAAAPLPAEPPPASPAPQPEPPPVAVPVPASQHALAPDGGARHGGRRGGRSRGGMSMSHEF